LASLKPGKRGSDSRAASVDKRTIPFLGWPSLKNPLQTRVLPSADHSPRYQTFPKTTDSFVASAVTFITGFLPTIDSQQAIRFPSGDQVGQSPSVTSRASPMSLPSAEAMNTLAPTTAPP